MPLTLTILSFVVVIFFFATYQKYSGDSGVMSTDLAILCVISYNYMYVNRL